MFAAETQMNAEIAGSASNIFIVLEWANPAWKGTKPFVSTAAFVILLVLIERFTAKRMCFQEKTLP
jgi:hypothetical protein